MLEKNEIQYFEELLCRTMEDMFGQSIVQNILSLGNYEKHADPLDQAIVNHDRDMAIMILERNKIKLSRLESALERLRQGTYGICEECEEMIARERLRVTPLTTLCIGCQRNQEACSAKKPLFS